MSSIDLQNIPESTAQGYTSFGTSKISLDLIVLELRGHMLIIGTSCMECI